MTSAALRALIDADILIKLSVLDVFESCLAAIGLEVSQCATMESMRLSAGLHKPQVRDRKAGPGAPAARLLATLQTIAGISRVHHEEAALSTEMISHSARLGLAVDAGEAIVMSVCIHRGIPYVTTGDKKAIRSLPQLERYVAGLVHIKGRLIPLEYLLATLVRKQGLTTVHARLLAGQHCDTGLRNLLAEVGSHEEGFLLRLDGKLSKLRSDAPGYVIS